MRGEEPTGRVENRCPAPGSGEATPGDPLNFVAASDAAGGVVRAVVHPSLRGETIEVGGLQNLTLNQLADRVLPGRPPRHTPGCPTPGWTPTFTSPAWGREFISYVS